MVAGGSPRLLGDLLTLARARFGGLGQAEVNLLEAAPRGEAAWCGPSHRDDDPANDPANADAWGSEREIRAELIRWLCVDRHAADRIDPRGIRIRAAKVVGALDLSFADVPFPLAFFRCLLTDDFDLKCARIPALSLAGTWTGAITADYLNVAASVFLRNGFRAEGEVRFLGAQIGGELDCSGGTLKNPGKYAFSADGVRVRGAVFLREGFHAVGEVSLVGAQIGGQLGCGGGTFKNPGKHALNAYGATVQGSVFLHEGFSAEGEVRLVGAQIGQLDCIGGTFKNPNGKALIANGATVKGGVFLGEGFNAEGEVQLLAAKIGGNLACAGCTFKNAEGKTITADGAIVRGAVFLRDGFSAEGEVRLLSVKIGGVLDCTRGRFKNPNGKALDANRANIEGSVFLSAGFNAEGEVWLVGTQIGGQLDCTRGKFAKLTAQTAKIQGGFFWGTLQGPQATRLDLRNASVGMLADEEPSWPATGNLFLDGFVYDRISAGPTDAQKRLEWLARVDRFTLQPYRQLAKVLRETGDNKGAREVLFEMERRRRKHEDRTWHARLWSFVLEITIGYGHKSKWALGWLGLLTLLGALLYGLGYASGAIAPSDKDAWPVFESVGQPPPHYPRFNAFVYSMEHTFPFVNLGQKDKWGPHPYSSVREPEREWSIFETLRDVQVRGVHPFRLPRPGVLQYFLWFQILAGWLLATLFVAGLTGIVRAE